MSLIATSPKELVQSLQQILLQINDQTDLTKELHDGKKERLTCKDWIATAEATRKAAKHPAELVQLDRHVLALRYRTTQIPDKAAPECVDPLLELLRQKYPMLFSNPSLGEFARKQIDHLSRHYPEFAKRLSEQLQKAPDEWAANFIKFCLQAPSQSWFREQQATHWIDIFIKYPEITDQLMKCGIYEKLGLYPENIAILTDNEVCLKVCLNDDRVSYVPIKKPLEQLLLKNIAQENQPYSTTLSEIFHEFEVSSSPGFSVSMYGVINLNSLLLGSKKNKDGAVSLINAKKWTEYKPCIELKLPELQKFWPIKGEPAFGFVLRADRQFPQVTPAKSQAFFDFVMRLPNGNYRVITMNPDQGHGIYLREQKMAFYPLSAEQGAKVIEMVAIDIEKYRISHGKKSVPYIDIEPYIDEIFGRNFYKFLEDLVDKLEKKEQNPRECEKIKKQLTLAKQTLDPEDFEKFLSPLIDKLVTTRDIPDIHQLIEKSLTTLKFLFQKEADKIPLPLQGDVETAARAAYNKDDEGKVLRESLLALTRLCFVALHPFSIKVTEAERNTTLIGKIFQIAQSITWKWLKDSLTDFLLLILGPFRGYRYQKLHGSEKGINKLVQTVRNLQPARYLNRPSQLFENYDVAALKRTAEDITKHLNVLASRNRS